MKYILAITLISFTCSCNSNDNPDQDDSVKPNYVGLPAPANITFSIVDQHPHDTSAFTQGLQLYNGKLYEGTGDYENSSLRITDWKTGTVEKKHMMGTDKIFGEGINILKNKIYQLTWESNIVYVYDVNNIEKPVNTIKWQYEGWGITNNGTDLIISDGSSNLYFVSPEDFKVKNTIGVVDNTGPKKNLNELEYINGFVFANVWGTDDILKIDPESGHVVGKMNLANLLQSTDRFPNTDVLNGIAYDSTTKTMLITGKRWPKLFEVKIN